MSHPPYGVGHTSRHEVGKQFKAQIVSHASSQGLDRTDNTAHHQIATRLQTPVPEAKRTQANYKQARQHVVTFNTRTSIRQGNRRVEPTSDSNQNKRTCPTSSQRLRLTNFHRQTQKPNKIRYGKPRTDLMISTWSAPEPADKNARNSKNTKARTTEATAAGQRTAQSSMYSDQKRRPEDSDQNTSARELKLRALERLGQTQHWNEPRALNCPE
ncbi:Hypothetical_protein [Hexamita inflata]|uniref:Hypothetical_protein n=1 Tax=Hexamita inflata TaxID=28002 RepID=A0AA86NQK5_9EUKA|nr:Hypothetical protein HINF_LOCUS11196 [Hexamita inflata]